MTGNLHVAHERGIIPRTIEEIFRHKSNFAKMEISYFEIYNEHGYDLIGTDDDAVYDSP